MHFKVLAKKSQERFLFRTIIILCWRSLESTFYHLFTKTIILISLIFDSSVLMFALCFQIHLVMLISKNEWYVACQSFSNSQSIQAVILTWGCLVEIYVSFDLFYLFPLKLVCKCLKSKLWTYMLMYLEFSCLKLTVQLSTIWTC